MGRDRPDKRGRRPFIEAISQAVWAWDQQQKEGEPPKIVPLPRPCDGCSDDEQRLFGCGYRDDTRDKAKATWRHGGKTCPRYYAQSIAVLSAQSHRRDYERGAMGNVLDLPARAYGALRAAEVAYHEWEAHQRDKHRSED